MWARRGQRSFWLEDRGGPFDIENWVNVTRVEMKEDEGARGERGWAEVADVGGVVELPLRG